MVTNLKIMVVKFTDAPLPMCLVISQVNTSDVQLLTTILSYTLNSYIVIVLVHSEFED